MAGLRFLERLRAMARNPDRRGNDEIEDVLHSVITHVSEVLNTRQGSALLDENMGIPDFTSMGLHFTPEDIPRMEQRIAALISVYEPRLCNVKAAVLADETPGATIMCFSLQASLLVGDSEKLAVHLLTRVTPEGKVSVER